MPVKWSCSNHRWISSNKRRITATGLRRWLGVMIEENGLIAGSLDGAVSPSVAGQAGQAIRNHVGIIESGVRHPVAERDTPVVSQFQRLTYEENLSFIDIQIGAIGTVIFDDQFVAVEFESRVISRDLIIVDPDIAVIRTANTELTRTGNIENLASIVEVDLESRRIEPDHGAIIINHSDRNAVTLSKFHNLKDITVAVDKIADYAGINPTNDHFVVRARRIGQAGRPVNGIPIDLIVMDEIITNTQAQPDIQREARTGFHP
jgi:hypothetical protein